MKSRGCEFGNGEMEGRRAKGPPLDKEKVECRRDRKCRGEQGGKWRNGAIYVPNFQSTPATKPRKDCREINEDISPRLDASQVSSKVAGKASARVRAGESVSSVCRDVCVRERERDGEGSALGEERKKERKKEKERKSWAQYLKAH